MNDEQQICMILNRISVFIISLMCLLVVFPLYAEMITPVSEDLSDSLTPFTLTPDLSLSYLVVSDLVKKGEQITGSVIVTNQGPVSASHISMDILLVQNNPDGNISIWLGTKVTDEIGAGTRGKIPFSFSVPVGIPDGEYYLKINIRSHELELFSSDNTITSSEPITIQKETIWRGENPNLRLTIDSVSTNTSSSGSSFTMTYTVINMNSDVAGSCKILFLLSPDINNLNSGFQLWEKNIFSVYSDMNEQEVLTDLIPDYIPPGFYHLVGIIDYTGMIQETDKTDNLFVYPEKIQITEPLNRLLEPYADQIAGYLYLKTNKYREYCGLSLLSFDNDLCNLAIGHTTDMIQRKYFSHYSPEGIDPTGRAELLGLSVTQSMDDGRTRTGIAENIIRIAAGHTIGKGYTGFVDPTTPEDVADVMMIEWINSPEHNKNLINPTIEKIGIGVRFNGEFFYATQNFF
ncbi:MAG: CAP domain-containing protein [Methanospirillum sp.]|nr:CAP domain-containing protein [Methanospirillum sp.]